MGKRREEKRKEEGREVGRSREEKRKKGEVERWGRRMGGVRR